MRVSQPDTVLTRGSLAIHSRDPAGTLRLLGVRELELSRGKRHHAIYNHAWKLCETSGMPFQWDVVPNPKA